MGEAVVILNDALKPDFRYMIKQKGGLLAKGRLLGIQFETLFEDGLYLDISRHAVDMALRIHDSLEQQGYASCTIHQPTSSFRFCRIVCLRNYAAVIRSPSGKKLTVHTVRCGSAPAGRLVKRM